jgi:hypothetical protein
LKIENAAENKFRCRYEHAAQKAFFDYVRAFHFMLQINEKNKNYSPGEKHAVMRASAPQHFNCAIGLPAEEKQIKIINKIIFHNLIMHINSLKYYM